SPANIKEIESQHKKILCEQNARNNKLQGNDKTKYIETCINKNEAAEAAANATSTKAAEKIERSQEKIKKREAKRVAPPVKSDEAAKSRTKSKRQPTQSNDPGPK
ncbi:MAG TPA: hypothetical protein VLS47_00695, partial [Gallionella sp.]|nr:hypothetical protein [Gallionella sp.]